jgi:hypothetical protein
MRADGSCPFCSPDTTKAVGITRVPANTGVSSESDNDRPVTEPVKFESLQLMELFRLKTGNRAVKVGRSSYITALGVGVTPCKMRIKPTKVVTKLEEDLAGSLKAKLKG